MGKHPVELISETKGMNGYQFQEWLKQRKQSELVDLDKMGMSLQGAVEKEMENRKKQ